MLHNGTDPVDYRVITPPGWDGSQSLPLLLVLHGAFSSSAILDEQAAAYESAFPDAVVACASTPTQGGFYIGEWEDLVAREFPGLVAEQFNADLSRTMLLGASMGGYAALKMAFAEPGRYLAVATLSPAVFPGETLADVDPRNAPGVLGELRDAMAASGYQDEHAVARLRRNADAVRRSGMPLRLECAGRDSFLLHQGAEYLHRVLWDLGIDHDYHLVQGADHIGPEVPARERRAREFLAEALQRLPRTLSPKHRQNPWPSPSASSGLCRHRDRLCRTG